MLEPTPVAPLGEGVVQVGWAAPATECGRGVGPKRSEVLGVRAEAPHGNRGWRRRDASASTTQRGMGGATAKLLSRPIGAVRGLAETSYGISRTERSATAHGRALGSRYTAVGGHRLRSP